MKKLLSLTALSFLFITNSALAKSVDLVGTWDVESKCLRIGENMNYTTPGNIFSATYQIAITWQDDNLFQGYVCDADVPSGIFFGAIDKKEISITSWYSITSGTLHGSGDEFTFISQNQQWYPDFAPGTCTGTATKISDTLDCNPVPPKRIFVTSQMYTGNLGGVEGANMKCQTLADTEILDGTFKAWISDNTSSPASSSWTHHQAQYVLLDGTVVASNWEDLTDGQINTRIDIDETGDTEQGQVWTNTKADGQKFSSDYSCEQWINNSTQLNAHVGDIEWDEEYQTEPEWWTDTYFGHSCSTLAHLYCFEQ